ncbi:MAG: TCR/Tet family MFS transporter [Pseudomonadota bacterium]
MKITPPVLFILFTVMIDAMGIGLIIPVMPELIRDVTGGGLASAALWGGVLSSSFAFMQFLFGPLLGNISDRFGRRPVLLVSLFVMAADYLVMAVAGSLWLLLAGRIVGGIAAATQSTAAAYMADTSTRDARGAGFGLVSAALGLGFVLGPPVGGVLGEWHHRAPFYAAAALAMANFIFGYYILRESLPPEKRRGFSLARANPFGALQQIRVHPGLGRLLIVLLLYHLAFTTYPAIWSFFTIARFGWDPAMIGVSLAVFGIAMALVQGWLIRVMIARRGEASTVLTGLWVAAGSFAILAFLQNGLAALVLIPFAALAAMTVPALQAIMSQRTPENAQGELQGIFTSVAALAMIVTPLAMTALFSAFTAQNTPVYMPGAPFLAACLLALAARFVFSGAVTSAERKRAETGRFPR